MANFQFAMHLVTHGGLASCVEVKCIRKPAHKPGFVFRRGGRRSFL